MTTKFKREASIHVYPSPAYYSASEVAGIWKPAQADYSNTGNANLYIHVPFCPRKCKFCYFTSFSAGRTVMARYTELLKQEMTLLASNPIVQSRVFHTLYIGGGTPTFLTAELLKEIIQFALAHFNFKKGFEFSIEARPGKEASEEKLSLLKSMGVNRISMGAQSFVPEILKANGRNHTIEDFYTVYGRVRSLGIPCINVDIMSGMLDETEETWATTIELLLKLSPENISLYNMYIYSHSDLYKKGLQSANRNGLTPETKEIEMSESFNNKVVNAGYIFANCTNIFAKSHDYIHRHQTSRLEGDEILGVGLSANSYFNHSVYQNYNDLDQYSVSVLRGELPISTAHNLTKYEEMKRTLIFGLRRINIDRHQFKSRYGEDPLEVFPEELAALIKDKLVEVSWDEITVAKNAYLFPHDIARKYLLSETEKKLERLFMKHKNLNIFASKRPK